MVFNFYSTIFYTKYILYLFILVLLCRQITCISRAVLDETQSFGNSFSVNLNYCILSVL